MSLRVAKSLRASVIMSSLFACMISISACQQEPETDPSLEEEIAAEQAVPMSADPADPNDTGVAMEPTLNEVQSDTIAEVNTGVTQLTYLCAPELTVEATYKEDTNEAVLSTDIGTVTANKTNDGTNPEIYEADTDLSGGAGFTQWRVAHEERATGVIRTSSEDSADVTIYECEQID